MALHRITKTFGGVRALREVSLEVSPGEVVALLGENGAGKSTLVGVAAGRLDPDAGSVTVAGRDITGTGPGGAAAAGVRLVPQELTLCPDMSVLDNVLLGARPRRWGVLLDRRSARVEVERRLNLLGVVGMDLDAPVDVLPVVERTFVQIARSFTRDARVLLIDEPTAPMDDAEVDRFLAVLRALGREGVAIVYISHRLDEIFRLADRVVVLRDGGTVAELTGSEMNRERVVSAMVGERDLGRDARTPPNASGALTLQVEGVSGAGVEDVSLSVRGGEVACVYGISGSGREKVGALIVGAVLRRSGSVSVDGRRVRSGSVADAVGAGVGYVPPERRAQGLVLESTVAANLTLAVLRRLSRWGWLLPGAPDGEARPWIERLSIKTPTPKTAVGALSGGSQQKVLLARWLAAGSAVLVLEEPTRGVDVGTKAEIYQLVAELAAAGRAVLVITSDIEEATLVGDSVYVMRDGRLHTQLHRPSQRRLALAAQGALEDSHA